MTIVFKTERHFPGVISKHEAEEVTPKSVMFRMGVPGRLTRERKETFYHRYHSTFIKAKQVATVELEMSLDGARERVALLQRALDKLEATEEKDL